MRRRKFKLSRLLPLLIAFVAAASTAWALSPPSHRLFGQAAQVHDGFSLNFATNKFYVKPAGSAAQYAPFTSLFQFARNSSASFRGSNGLIQYANENQFQQSQTFDNAYWTKQQATVSADATAAPDGTTTADKLVEDNTSNFHDLLHAASTTGLVETLSVFAKPAGRNFIVLQLGSNAFYFNVSLGTIGAGGGLTATIAPAGNGWYRCSVSGIASNANAIIFLASADGTGSYAGDGASGVYLWGAQLQMGSSVGSYLATTSAAKFDGPRVEYDGTGNLLGLLLEGARTNLMLQSEAFDNASWTKSGLAATPVTANAVVAPDGATTGDTIVEASGGTFHFVQQDVTVSANQPYTDSTWFKAAGRGFIRIQLSNTTATTGCFVDVNLTTGATGTVTTFGTGSAAAASVSAYSNSWFRAALTCTIDNSSTTARTQFILASALGTTSYAGDGLSGVSMWGAQIELAQFTSTYLPTTTATVARVADSLSRTDSPKIISDGAGTTYAEINFPQVTALGQYTVLSKNNVFDNSMLMFRITTTSEIHDNTTAVSKNGAVAGVNKLATSYGSGGLASTIGGQTVVTGAYDGTITSGTNVQIGGRGSATVDSLFGHVRRLDYWEKQLPNSQLQALTR